MASDGTDRLPAHRKPGRKGKRGGRGGSGGTRYAETLADDICAWIAAGQTLRDYCRQPGKPHHSVVYDWLDAHPDFARRFARARQSGYDVMAQECVHIADEGTGEVDRDKLRVWTRLQLLARWDPKRYGERQQLEHSGGVSLQVVTGVPRE